MSSLAVACCVFVCVFGATLAAMVVKQILPEHHLNAESRDVVKLGMGLIATLSALVLGLLIATAKGTYDAQTGVVKELAANLVLLDRVLGMYGPDTKDARELLKAGAVATVERIWPEDSSGTRSLAPGEEAKAAGDAMYDRIAELSPGTEAQRALKGRALDVSSNLAQWRLRLFANQDSSLPTAFFVVLVFWLGILFAGYGLLAPPNATVLAVLLVCTASMSGAVFLMMELSTPFSGVVRVSSVPLHDAISLIGR